MILPPDPTRPRRRVRRTVVLATVLTIASFALAGCGAQSGSESAVDANGKIDLSKVTLSVGDQKGGSQAVLDAAGLQHTPYKIQWHSFTSGPPLLEALNAGSIDVGGVGNTPPIFAAAAKSNLTVVSAYTQGSVGDQIVVPQGSPIHSVADLKGKTVAVAQGSSANYDLLAQLKKAGLTYADVKVQDLQPSDALAAFSSHHVDAWAIWDPYTSQALLTEHARTLATGKGLTNGYGFLAANPSSLQDPATERAIADFVTRLRKARVWSATHKAAWAQAWAQETGLPVSVTRHAADEQTATQVPIDKKLIASEQTMADAFAANKLIPSALDVSAIFDPRFNSSLEENK